MIFIELRIDVYTSRENLTTKKKDFISKLKEKQCVQIHVSTTITTIRLFKKKRKNRNCFYQTLSYRRCIVGMLWNFDDAYVQVT